MIALLWRFVCCCIALSALFLLLALAAAIFNQKDLTRLLAACLGISIIASFLAADIFVMIVCGRAGLGLQ